MSIVLLLGAVQGAVVAIGLLRKQTNRQANQLLSGLVLILTLKLIPYIIGYAGFYVAYPWLDLAPFDLFLGVGPLLYLYVYRLTKPALPTHWKRHLIPVGLQLTVYLILFIQPLSFKNRFESSIGAPFNVVENALEVLSICWYLWLSGATYKSYDGWLRNQFGDPDAHRLKNLRTNLHLISGTLLAFVGAKIWGLVVHPVSYFQMFPIYVVLTLVVYSFGFTAFQFADIEFPTLIEAVPTKEIDWEAVASDYTRQLEALEFWRDPLLSIATASEALNTSEARLSRAINSGKGMSFSEWINRYRIDQVALRLCSGETSQTILEIAFACGFNSKATFHRWFRTFKGCTPSEFRERCRQDELPVPIPNPVQPQSHKPSV